MSLKKRILAEFLKKLLGIKLRRTLGHLVDLKYVLDAASSLGLYSLTVLFFQNLYKNKQQLDRRQFQARIMYLHISLHFFSHKN